MRIKILAALLAAATPAGAFEFKTDSTGSAVRWAEGLVPYTIERGGGKDVPGQRSAAAVERGVAAWGEVGTAALRFVPREPLAESRLGYDSRAGAQNENLITFEDKDWPFDPAAVAVTVATYRVSTHEIIDADVLFNGENHRWARYGEGKEPPNAYDLENAATHELGHMVGLAHNGAEPDATMYPRARPGEIAKRTLDADDAAGVSGLYPLSERAGFLPPKGKVEQPPAPEDREDTGCASGGGAGWLAAALALGAWALARRRRMALAPALLALCAAGAEAATFVPLTLDELAGRAAVVVRARAMARNDAWEGTLIYATTTAATVQCLKGPCPALFLVRQPGGEVGDLGQSVSGSTPLVPGQEVVLFLERDPRAAPGVLRPVGMDQGVLLVATGAFGTPVVRPIGEAAPQLANGAPAAVFSLGEVQRAVAAERRP